LAEKSASIESLKERAERFLMPNYGSRDVALVRGKGCRVWDSEGNEYLDFLAGIGVNNLAIAIRMWLLRFATRQRR